MNFNLFSENDLSDEQLQRLMQLTAVDIIERVETAKKITQESLHTEIVKTSSESAKQIGITCGK